MIMRRRQTVGQLLFGIRWPFLPLFCHLVFPLIWASPFVKDNGYSCSECHEGSQTLGLDSRKFSTPPWRSLLFELLAVHEAHFWYVLRLVSYDAVGSFSPTRPWVRRWPQLSVTLLDMRFFSKNEMLGITSVESSSRHHLWPSHPAWHWVHFQMGKSYTHVTLELSQNKTEFTTKIKTLEV